MATQFTKPLLASEIARLVGGNLTGDESLQASGVSSDREPVAGTIALLGGKGAPAKFQDALAKGVKLFLVEKKNVRSLSGSDVSYITVDHGTLALAKLLDLCERKSATKPGVHPTASIDEGCEIGHDVTIGPFCVIGRGVKVGAGTVLHAHVHLYPGSSVGKECVIHSFVAIRDQCKIGNNCLIHNHAVIGADGFGFTPENGGIKKVPQLGNVEIGNHVEIGAATCIDRGAIDPTRIGDFTKIDNLVQVGHNVQIGKGCLICAGNMIGGSTKIHDGVVLGGAVAVADHIEIVSGVRVGGGSAVSSSLLERGDYSGYPIMPITKWRRLQVNLQNQLGIPLKEEDQ